MKPIRRSDKDPGARLLGTLDNALRTLATKPAGPSRPSPATKRDNKPMNAKDRRHAAGLMRINHAGEVAAQALYQGHKLVARDPQLVAQLDDAAEEEFDHLVWCKGRLDELGETTSRLNPVWYAGAYAMGALSGLAGDRWGLGFIDETERQVVEHLDGHLQRLPLKDERSREILGTMKREEAAHADHARDSGAAVLPGPVRGLMRLAAGVMKAAAYRV
ncbi:MAG: 2-polyprenyl-3-methyl-6-methoxy-1,4-benzoquinone monooxygenase [Pseudomonadota bacterium]